MNFAVQLWGEPGPPGPSPHTPHLHQLLVAVVSGNGGSRGVSPLVTSKGRRPVFHGVWGSFPHPIHDHFQTKKKGFTSPTGHNTHNPLTFVHNLLHIGNLVASFINNLKLVAATGSCN